MTSLRPHLILAEGDHLLAALLIEILDEAGFRVSHAHNGLEALEIENRMPADFLITDLRMPGMDGVELVTRIRGIRPNLPILVLTAYNKFIPDEDDLLTVMYKPVQDYKIIQSVMRFFPEHAP